MRVICVDDALPIMEDTVAMCRKLPKITSVTGFTRPREALRWLEDHPVEIALLDIDMPDINGLVLAEKIKRRYPDAAVIFLTAFEQFAVQAIQQLRPDAKQSAFDFQKLINAGGSERFPQGADNHVQVFLS